MTVSMRLMNARDAYKYLLKSVAAGDGRRDLSTPLTRYYTEEGCPPGYWLGTGLHDLHDPAVAVGEQVSELQLQLLIGHSAHHDRRVAREGVPTVPVCAGQDRPARQRAARTFGGRRPCRRCAADRAGRTRQADAESCRGVRLHVLSAEVGQRVVGCRRRRTQALIAEAHHAAVRDVLDSHGTRDRLHPHRDEQPRRRSRPPRYLCGDPMVGSRSLGSV